MFFFFQAEDGIRDWSVTGVQTCALPICQIKCHSRPSRSEFQNAKATEQRTTRCMQANVPVGVRVIGLCVAPIQVECGGDRKSRRVGKECRTRRGEAQSKRKEKDEREQAW